MTMIEFLAIKEELVSGDKVILSLPITTNLLQPYGLMHGGVSAILAETAASMGAKAWLNSAEKIPVGMDIQTRHLKSTGLGNIVATALPISLGKKVQVWEITITNQAGLVISHSTCSLLMIDKPDQM